MRYTAILRADVEIASQSVGGCIVRRPAAGLETLPVWVECEAKTGPGRITVPPVPAAWWKLAGQPETTLWLPHSVVGWDRPRNFVLQNGREQRGFERCDAHGVRTPLQTLTRMSEGSLYRRARDVAQDDLRFEFEKSGSDRDRNTANGILNPWMVEIDSTSGCEDDEGRHAVMAAIREHRADLHLDVPPEDWLRARIHTRLAERWDAWRNRPKQPAMPPIPALLFGTKGNAAARARAFLVLDAFRGTFIVSRRNPSGGDEERIGRKERNLPRPRWLASVSGRDPLVSESLRALGVDPGDSRSGEEAGGWADGWRRDGPSNAESEGLETLIAGAAQNVQDELTDLVHDAQVSRAEAEAIENAVEEARRDGAGALNPFIRRHVVPRSNFEVDLPDGPRWLDVFDKKKAEKWRTAQGAWRLDPRPNRYRSPRTWLRLVEPPGDHDILTVPREWEAPSYRWKRHFLVGLFRPGVEGDPRWIWRESSRLGIGRLGEDTSLGSPGRGVIATPEVDGRGEVDWPAGIDL